MPFDTIPKVLESDTSWIKTKVDENGLLNLSRLHRHDDTKNMVFTKFVIESISEKLQKFMFGFSDRAKVLLNERPLYYGNNTFKSRDYRFLGSIGYYDEVYLPLKKGRNEIVIGVSESFDGWSILVKHTH